MRRPHHLVAGSIVLVAMLSACGNTGTSPATGLSSLPPAASATALSTAAPASPLPSTSSDLLADLDIGGRTMHILCVGPVAIGRPTVVFESGLGGDAGQWSDVLHELDGTVRACAYDRAGDGQSPPATAGRTTADQVADLRALLASAGVAPPYLLVGYSLGGWNVIVHAADHPADVIGAVMVDVRPPAASRLWLKALPPAAATESEAIRQAREESTTFDTDPTLNPEGLRLGESATEAIAADGLGSKPLVVLAATDTSAISEGFEPDLAGRLVDIWWEGQAELASRSTAGRLVKVENATHELPFERPDAVADAIREVLGD